MASDGITPTDKPTARTHVQVNEQQNLTELSREYIYHAVTRKNVITANSSKPFTSDQNLLDSGQCKRFYVDVRWWPWLCPGFCDHSESDFRIKWLFEYAKIIISRSIHVAIVAISIYQVSWKKNSFWIFEFFFLWSQKFKNFLGLFFRDVHCSF